MKFNCSLIGLGYWGTKVLQKIESNPDLNIKYICKKNIEKKNYKNIQIFDDFTKCYDRSIKIVFICVNPSINLKITDFFLKKNTHVFIEKPAFYFNDEFLHIYNLAKRKNLILHIDYIHTYNDNLLYFHKMLKYINIKKPHKVNLIIGDSKLSKTNISPLYDWGSHALSIVAYIFKIRDISKLNYQIKFKGNKNKFNTILTFSNKNCLFKIKFGNNLTKKTTLFSIKQDNNYLKYLDTVLKYRINGKSFTKNYQKIDPLSKSIDNLVKSISKKLIRKDFKFSKIIYVLEKLK